MNEFYLSLPSNTSKALGAHRDNSTSEFRVKLPTDIRLKGQWEIALVEAQYPYSWDNVPNIPGPFLLTNQIVISEDLTGIAEIVSLYPGHYDDIDHLMACIHSVLEDIKKRKKDKLMFLKGSLEIGYHPIYRRVLIRMKKGYRITLSEHLAYMMGFKSPNLENRVTMGQYPPDMRGGIDSLFVYCDIVAPQIVGNSMQPLIRILPVEGKYGDIIHRVFVSPHYVDVLQKDFASVSISIKTDRDLPVPFKFGKTIIKLHFRRKI